MYHKLGLLVKLETFLCMFPKTLTEKMQKIGEKGYVGRFKPKKKSCSSYTTEKMYVSLINFIYCLLKDKTMKDHSATQQKLKCENSKA